MLMRNNTSSLTGLTVQHSLSDHDRLASYVTRLGVLDFVNWQQPQSWGWPWSGSLCKYKFYGCHAYDDYVNRLQTLLLQLCRPHFALTVINELHLLCLRAVGTSYQWPLSVLTCDCLAGASMNIAYWQIFWDRPY